MAKETTRTLASELNNTSAGLCGRHLTSLDVVTPLADAAAATSARSQASQPSHLAPPGIGSFEFGFSDAAIVRYTVSFQRWE